MTIGAAELGCGRARSSRPRGLVRPLDPPAAAGRGRPDDALLARLPAGHGETPANDPAGRVEDGHATRASRASLHEIGISRAAGRHRASPGTRRKPSVVSTTNVRVMVDGRPRSSVA